MYARITRDLLYDGATITNDRSGDIIIGDKTTDDHVGGMLDVRLLDDDRIPYFLARADDDALEDLYEWAYHDSGVTILQVKHGANWVDEIS